jgi:hypothetical protein
MAGQPPPDGESGLRYELQKARTERYNRYNNFDFNVTNPLSTAVGIPLKGGLVFLTPDNRGPGTRIRMTWRHASAFFKVTDKMVLRSGYGIHTADDCVSTRPRTSPPGLCYHHHLGDKPWR